MRTLRPAFIHATNEAFWSAGEKYELDVLFVAADRHSVTEWMARSRPGALPDTSHVGFAGLAAWTDEIGDPVIESWAAIATDVGAMRELVYRSTWPDTSERVDDDVHELVASLVDACLDRAAKLSDQYFGLPLPVEFITSRDGDGPARLAEVSESR